MQDGPARSSLSLMTLTSYSPPAHQLWFSHTQTPLYSCYSMLAQGGTELEPWEERGGWRPHDGHYDGFPIVMCSHSVLT